jgi:hypothetical protein
MVNRLLICAAGGDIRRTPPTIQERCIDIADPPYSVEKRSSKITEKLNFCPVASEL